VHNTIKLRRSNWSLIGIFLILLTDVESFVRERITAGKVTSEQISSIMMFARDAQKNYVISKVLAAIHC